MVTPCIVPMVEVIFCWSRTTCWMMSAQTLTSIQPLAAVLPVCERGNETRRSLRRKLRPRIRSLLLPPSFSIFLPSPAGRPSTGSGSMQMSLEPVAILVGRWHAPIELLSSTVPTRCSQMVLGARGPRAHLGRNVRQGERDKEEKHWGETRKTRGQNRQVDFDAGESCA